MLHYYTDEINTLVLISLLKQHGIHKVIASPGTTNISFIGSIQNDSWFEIFSAVDERSAAFMACGLAEESGEPVVLSCTGATASRNYIPGLTEAYYRKIPILAITSTQHVGRVGHYVAQVIDRSQPFVDMVKRSVTIPTVYCKEDEEFAVTEINNSILELKHGECGPVHINLSTIYSDNFVVKTLPKYRKIERIIKNGIYPNLPQGRIAIFVGAHSAFSKAEEQAIDAFCKANNAVVLCDHVSNYKGNYRFLASLVNSQEVDLGYKKFDLVIYIGSVHGTYLPFSSRELWRVNPDGVIRDPNRNLTFVFEMEEYEFFSHYTEGNSDDSLIRECKEVHNNLLNRIPDIPFSNMWIANKTAGKIPSNAVMHFSILNTLRVWSYFDIHKTILGYSNVGGYGIDGCASSCLGSALKNKDIQHFLIIGDLSFFYDLNTLLNEIPNNIHILLINNGVGTEFKNYNHRAFKFADDADSFMAAKGHNGNKQINLVSQICEKIGIRYSFAQSKEQYLEVVDKWISDGPSLLEVFTDDVDESVSLQMVNSIVKDMSFKSRLKRNVLGKIIIKIKSIILRR